MLDDKVYLQLNKLIRDNKLTINELYTLITYLYRRYNELLVQDTIMKLVDNIRYSDMAPKEPKATGSEFLKYLGLESMRNMP